MSYVKNVWVNGDVITEDKLNHMEEGIEEASQGGGGGSSDATYIEFLYNYDDDKIECSKTFSEIETLIEDGSIFIAYFPPRVGAYMGYDTVADEQGISKIKFFFIGYGQLSENDYGLIIVTLEMNRNNEITPDDSQYVLTPFVSP